MKDHTERFEEMISEIVLLLKAHALIEEMKSPMGRGMILSDKHFGIHLKQKNPELAAILSVCERLRKEAEWCDDDLLQLRNASVPKERCGVRNCSGYGKQMIWGERGNAVCSSVLDEVKK